MAQLDFKGKTFVRNHHLLVKYHELLPDESKSLTEKVSLHDNLIIHGDNLKALKALLPLYAGKIKCIYIDPPYNTGNEKWVYSDNVNSPMLQDWFGKVVDRDDLTRHDKWLCMMMPRLKLLRELLSEDGFIFISIDDNEIHHLRMLTDEIFGESNYRNTIAVKRGIKNVQAQFETVDRLALGHEYILCYSKTNNVRLPKLSHGLSEQEAGKWDTFWRGTDRPTMRYEIFGITPKDGQWRWEKNRAYKAKDNYEYYIHNSADTITLDDYFIDHFATTRERLNFVRLSEGGVVQYYVPPRSYKLISDNWLDISIGSHYTNFDTEKSVDIVSRAIRWICKDVKDSIVLDSFAGSATTGHSVLKINSEDGGNRRFVLIECEDYADTLTANRIRRVITGSIEPEDGNTEPQLEGTFSYFELGKPLELEGLLDGSSLPSYTELARYIFYIATGEEFNEQLVDEHSHFIGESKQYQVFLYYEPAIEQLKELAFTLDKALALPALKPEKRYLVFAPTKYLDQDHLDQFRVDFAQLPFEIYERTR